MKTITIKNCGECPNVDHTGAFTKGGAKPCCNHSKTVELKGNDCFKRVIPYRTDYSTNRPFRVPRRIPDWCPL